MTRQDALRKFNNLFIPVYLLFLGVEGIGLVAWNYTHFLKHFWSITCNLSCNTSLVFPGILGALWALGLYFWWKKNIAWVWGTSVIPFFIFSYLYLQPSAF